MDQDQLSKGRGKAFTFTEISDGTEIFKAHSYGNGHFIQGIPSAGFEPCFSLYKAHATLNIQIHDNELFWWLHAIPSLRDGFDSNATHSTISMAHLLPYYHEVRERFNLYRYQGLGFNALDLFVLHFLRDRSIFAIFGLEHLCQAGILTQGHFGDLDDWDYSISKDLDRLDDLISELNERGELDDLQELDEPDELHHELNAGSLVTAMVSLKKLCKHRLKLVLNSCHDRYELSRIRWQLLSERVSSEPVSSERILPFEVRSLINSAVIVPSGDSLWCEETSHFGEQGTWDAALLAQERKKRIAMLRTLFAKIDSSRKDLLRAASSQSASARLRTLVLDLGAPGIIWKRGTRVIRDIAKGSTPSGLAQIVSVLQVADAMRLAVPPSDLVCSREEFANDIPKWAALLVEEDRSVLLEIAEHLWGRPTVKEVAVTPRISSLLVDLEGLVKCLVRSCGLSDHDSVFDQGFGHPSSFDRLEALRERYLPETLYTHTYEAEPLSADRDLLPAPDIQETPHINLPEPPDPEGGHSGILKEITYLLTGAILGAVLLFLCLSQHSYPTIHLPVMAPEDGQNLGLDQILNRNCVILALYIGAASCLDLGSWKRTNHSPPQTSPSPEIPNSLFPGKAAEHLAAFESPSEGIYTRTVPPSTGDAAMEDASSDSSRELSSQAATSSFTASISPSTTKTPRTPVFANTTGSEDGAIHCKVGSCKSIIKLGKNGPRGQRSNYTKHMRDHHSKKRMFKCRWGCGRERPIKFNVEIHEKTCKKRTDGNRESFGQSRH